MIKNLISSANLHCFIFILLFLSGCSYFQNDTSSNLDKQIELQQIQHELASEPVAVDKKTAMEFEQIGDRYIQNGDTNRAYLNYMKGLGTEPNNISLLHKQGSLLIKKNKFIEAAQVYDRLLSLAEKDPQALSGRSKAYFGQGKIAEAELGFLAALEINKNDWQAHEYLGLISSQKQEYDKALTHFKTALTYKPNDISISNNLAVTYYLNGNFKEAAHLLSALAPTTNDRKIYNNLALTYFQLGHYQNALEAFKKGSSNEAAAYNNIGQEYLYSKKYNEAIESFEKAISLHPKFYPSAQKNLEQAKHELSYVLASKSQ